MYAAGEMAPNSLFFFFFFSLSLTYSVLFSLSQGKIHSKRFRR